MKAIIIDDNTKAANDLNKKLAEYKDIQVGGMAANGFSGLELVHETHPDVVFLDVELPDISGLEFLERSAYLQSDACKVIIYTSFDKYILPAFRKQAFDVLLKPIDPKDLKTVIERLEKSDNTPATPATVKTHNDSKYLLYTNTFDFTLVDKADIGLFQYNSEARCWEGIVAGFKKPVKLRRTIKSDQLLNLDKMFVQVNQKYIVNFNYLIEVVDNECHFFPPFDKIDYVSVGRVYRKKLRESFLNL